MPASDNTRPTQFGARVILLLILLVPAMCGALAARLLPATADDGGQPRVAIVATSPTTPSSPGDKLTQKLSATTGYTWQTMSATDAAQQLSTASVFAVVTIPEAFATTTATKSTTTPNTTTSPTHVTVVPSGDATDDRYTRLERAVSTAAAQAGLEGLLVTVSSARTNLNVAALTAAGLKAAAANADTTVTEVLNSVNQLVGQADPLVAQAQTLVAAIREYSTLINDLSGTLSGFAHSMRDVTLTLGELQNGTTVMNNGLQVVLDTLQATAAVRAQLGTVVRPVAQALSASGFPEGQQVGNQLTALLTAVDGIDQPQTTTGIDSLQTGTQLLGAQLDNLSPLLGQPVDAQTRLVDVLNLAVQRLTEIGTFLAQGDTTINQVMGQLNGAKDLVPTMESQIRGQLDQLKAATTQLVTSLNAGVTGLPDTSTATVNRLSPTTPADQHTATPTLAPHVMKAVMVVLLGSVMIALLQVPLARGLQLRGRTAATASALSWILAGCAAIGIATIAGTLLGGQHAASAYGSAAIAVVAMVALATALTRVAGPLGLALMLAAVLAVVAIDTVARTDSAIAAGLLPSRYVATGLATASSAGFTDTLLLPLVVLTASALCAIAVSRHSDSVIARRRIQ